MGLGVGQTKLQRYLTQERRRRQGHALGTEIAFDLKHQSVHARAKVRTRQHGAIHATVGIGHRLAQQTPGGAVCAA